MPFLLLPGRKTLRANYENTDHCKKKKKKKKRREKKDPHPKNQTKPNQTKPNKQTNKQNKKNKKTKTQTKNIPTNANPYTKVVERLYSIIQLTVAPYL